MRVSYPDWTKISVKRMGFKLIIYYAGKLYVEKVVTVPRGIARVFWVFRILKFSLNLLMSFHNIKIFIKFVNKLFNHYR